MPPTPPVEDPAADPVSVATTVGSVVRLYAGDDTSAPVRYGVVVTLDPTRVVDLGPAREYGLPVESI